MLHYRRSVLCQTLLVTGALASTASLALGQAKKPHRAAAGTVDAVAGQIMLYCQPNTPQNEVNRLAGLVGGQLKPLLLTDAYLLTLDAAHADQASTAAAISQLKLEASVKGVGPNNIAYKMQTSGGATGISPNDPRYVKGDQYALSLINMPLAWTLQKGNVNFSVGCIDSGCDPQHEDTPIISPGSFDVADNDSDVTADGADGPGEFDHGTGTSGVMLAHTNNSKGIAGVIWNQMPCFFVKVEKKGDTTGGLPVDVLTNAFVYVAKNAAKYNVVAVNYSIGADVSASIFDPSGAYTAAVNSCIAANVHVVGAAGNETFGGDTVNDLPGVVKVSAVGRSPSKLTYYSNFNNITIAAPGGEQFSATDPNGVLVMNQSTSPSPALYSFEQGTSFAAPHVTAVLGLLRSVPGVDYNRAINALLSSANHSITGQTTVPDPKFGVGLLDAYAALAKVSNVVIISDPQGVDPTTNTSTAPSQAAPLPVETLRPTIRFEASNPKLVNGIPQVNVTLTTPSGSRPLITNGVVDPTSAALVTNFHIKDISTDPSFPQFDISFRYIAGTSTTPQQQQITVVSTPADPSFTPAQAALTYNVAPHVFPAGVSFVSFPVVETPSDSPDPSNSQRDIKSILGTNSVILYRWINSPVVDAKGKQTVQGQYAIYGSGASDTLSQFATLHPSDVKTTPTPQVDPRDLNASGNPIEPAAVTTDSTPAGLGYFMNLTAGSAFQSYGRTFSQQTIKVPLHEGWNMIGDPFQFPIAFSNLTIQAPNGTIYASSDAVNAKLLLPFIYRFVGNDYQFQTLPNGTLYPWEGNWIYVIPKDPTSVNPSANALTMIMTPTQAGTTRGVRASTVSVKTTRGVQSMSNRPEVRGPGSWALRLVARTKNMADSYNYIGMSSTAQDGDDLTKAPKPPRIGTNITLGIQRGTQGGLYAQDLRSLGGTKTWNVVVNTDQPNSDVTLSWPDSHSLPRNYQVTLKDNLTGQVLDIRNRSAFQFNSGPKAQSREFTITAQPGNTGDRVAFNSVFVTQRGLSKATGQSTFQIDYNISQNAQVDVSILNTGGRVITQLDSGRAASSGDNHVLWNGHDGQNHAVPAGAYIVRLRAVSSEGRVTQYHYPLTVTGR